MKPLVIQFFALFASFAGNVIAQRNLPLDAIPEPDPLAQQASFVLDEGLEINLFASDPMIAKPVGMNWDARGRLWVVSSRLYPHIKPGQRSDDQVVVLEDTTGDGKADKSTVFAEDLLIPTGIQPGDGGVYVANSTEMLFLKDTDGDLKEDERRVILSGFGTEDTHHIIHAFRCGPEGLLYFNQSIYIHSHIETPHGVRRLMAGGIWHFRPETMELEVFARGFVNSWGHAWDRYGQSFATDGAYVEGINFVFPGSVFFTAYNAKRIMKGLNSGQPKHCGLEVINSSHFPDDWQGNMITNDFRGHRVNRFIVSESGSGYVSRQAPDLIKTTHGAFRPIDCKMGPDGALYIADWYNPIIQHGEVDFRDPRRDHIHGRIWRVTYKGRPLSKKPDVADQPLGKVVEQLRSPDGLTRQFAKQELRNRGHVEAVAALAEAEAVTPEDKLELLWAYQAVNDLNESLLRELLRNDDHRIRAAAVRVLYHWHDRVEGALKLLGHAVRDPHPQVRLEAVNALRNTGGAQAFSMAMAALAHPVDANLDFALWLTARELERDWLPALQAGELGLAPEALQFTLAASEKPELIGHLHERFTKAAARAKRGDASSQSLLDSKKELAGLIDLFAGAGAPETLDVLYDHALREKDDEVLRRLFEAAVQRKVRPSQLREDALVPLALEGKPHALLLGGAWRIEAIRPILERRLEERAAAPEYSVSALTHLGDENAGKVLQTVASDQGWPAKIRAAAIAGLLQIDNEAGIDASVHFLTQAETSEGVDTVLRAFLGRKDGPKQLAAALEGKTIAPEVARSGVQQASSSGGGTASLVAVITEAGGLTPVTKGLSEEEMVAMVKAVGEKGDPHRGEQIYRRSALLCQTCHAIGGGGGVIGPDMLSVGASAPVDYIVDSLLEPNKKIKEGYHTTVLTTKDSQVVTGGLTSRDG